MSSATSPILSATLKVASGPRAGKGITLRAGETRRVGRSVSADLSIPHDATLSSEHFAIECSRTMTRIRTLKGDIVVNGRRAIELPLVDGDRIVAGQTTFVVNVVHQAGDVPQQAHAQRSPIGHRGRPWDSALRDVDAAVRREALLAAAWAKQAWLLDHLREASVRPEPDCWTELWLLAVLGSERDWKHLAQAAQATDLGPRRLQLLGTLGNPAGMNVVLSAMKNPDPATAIVAGAAFTKMTGVGVDSDRRVSLVNAGEEEEFADEVWLPDPVRAESYWSDAKTRYGNGARLCRGCDVAAGVSEEALRLFDLESLWEMALRTRYQSRSKSPDALLGLRASDFLCVRFGSFSGSRVQSR